MNKRLRVYFLAVFLLIARTVSVQAGVIPPTPAQLARATEMDNSFLQSLFEVSSHSFDTVAAEKDVDWFFRQGADGNARTEDGMPAICIAALHSKDSVEFFRGLVRLGINPRVQGPRGETPYSMALSVGNTGIARYCQRRGISR